MSWHADVRRSSIIAHSLAEFKIRTYVETGVYEGETIRHYAWFVQRAIGCDVNSAAIEIAHGRIEDEGQPGIELKVADSESFLSKARIEEPAFFYLDSNWMPVWPAMAEIDIIRARWPRHLAVVNNVRIRNNPNFAGRKEASDGMFEALVTHYTQILVPSYAIHEPFTGYVLLNSFADRIPYPRSEYMDLCVVEPR